MPNSSPSNPSRSQYTPLLSSCQDSLGKKPARFRYVVPSIAVIHASLPDGVSTRTTSQEPRRQIHLLRQRLSVGRVICQPGLDDPRRGIDKEITGRGNEAIVVSLTG